MPLVFSSDLWNLQFWQSVSLALSSIAVDASHRRKGIGKRLTQWGLNAAGESKQDIWLIAAPEGMQMYRSMGFTTIGEGRRVGEPQYVMLKLYEQQIHQ